jgi:hypothetical protein
MAKETATIFSVCLRRARLPPKAGREPIGLYFYTLLLLNMAKDKTRGNGGAAKNRYRINIMQSRHRR